ncbi:MAG: hypothetical protein IPL61_31620 [Myxococcales bacterium]|nr:hypothetical protein [Myxococcales bacterium]
MIIASDLVGTRGGVEADLEVIKNDAWNDAIDAGELVVHDGGVALDDDFSASGAAVLIKGDLTVAGTVSLDETGTLIVTGRLRCKNLACEGNLEIQGDVDVGETIFGYYQAGVSCFHGAVRAALFVQGDHAFEYDPAQLAVGAHLAFTNFGGLRVGTAAEARAALSDDAYAALARLMGLAADGPSGGDAIRLLRTDGFRRG